MKDINDRVHEKCGKMRSTKDYDMFDLHEFNRDIGTTKWLEDSMRKFGFHDAYPIHVVRNGDKRLKIKAGHHRFFVARKLGIPVKFVVCDNDDITIHELEKATRKWTTNDYLQSHARAGSLDYLKLKEYHEKTGIGISNCISMLSGETAGSNNNAGLFKDGKFRVSKSRHAEIVADIVMWLKEHGVIFATNDLFVRAISRCVWVKELDIPTLKKKIKNHTAIIIKQPTLDGYIGMIEDLYNTANRTKIPLAFLADEAARKRNPCGK